MSQGTAIQALARAARRLQDPTYLAVARRALPLFSEAPPLGVRRRTRRGAWYLLYSYAPRQLVLNGFLQSLIGLYDLGRLGPDARARRLFRAGDAEARASVHRYDTGSWSLYEPGVRSDYSYHVLVRDFLRGLCTRTRAGPYCRTADRFTSYLGAVASARCSRRARSSTPARAASGKTSVAACTALACGRGRPAHARPLDRPGPLARRRARPPGRRRADARRRGRCARSRSRRRRRWSATGRPCRPGSASCCSSAGVDRISAEELTVPPGMDELFSLLRLKAHHESGEWDVIVVDCAPTGETLRLLSFPDVARWWLDKVFPWEQEILAAAPPHRPLAARPPRAERGGLRRRPARSSATSSR